MINLRGKEENAIKIKKSAIINIKKILEIWFHNARERKYLKKLIADIIAKKKESVCKQCKIDVELNAIEKLPFLQILKEFRIKLAGLPFLKEEWRRFYEKTQKFITLCIECEIKYRKRNKRKMFNFDANLLKKRAKKVHYYQNFFFYLYFCLKRKRMRRKRKKILLKYYC